MQVSCVPISAVIIQKVEDAYEFSYVSREKDPPDISDAITVICSFMEQAVKSMMNTQPDLSLTEVHHGVRLKTGVLLNG